MKIKLKNFRCYLEKEFDIGDNGLVLLTGPSGSGKSTIMMAIMFALYGVGTKLVSIGETHCEVEVIFKDLKVFRRTKPNRLVVKDLISQQEYSDDAGETIIEERFGLSFETICYLQQNFAKSFIMMSPADKLEFIEKTIFKTVNIENIKKKCSELIARKNNDLVSATSQFEFCNQHLLKLVEPNKVSFPIKTKDIEKTIKNQNTKFNNCKIIIKRNEARIEVIKDELSRFRIMEAKVGSKKENLIKLKFDLKKYNEFKTSLNYTNEDDVCLEDFKNKLMVLTANKELLFLKEKLKLDKERFEIMKKEEIDSRNNEIEEWKQSLWKECKKDEIEPQIETEKQFIKDYDELVRLESSLTNVNETLLKENKIKLQESRKEYERKKELQATLELQKKIYTCPCCSAALQFNNNSLKTYEKDIVKIDVNEKKLRKEIDDLSTLISILEIDIPKTENNLENNKSYLKQIQRIKKIYNNEIGDRKEAEDNIECLRNYKSSQLDLEKKIDIESSKKYSVSLTSFMNQIDIQKNKIKSLEAKQKETELCSESEDELRQQIHTLEKNKDAFETNEKFISKLMVEIVNIENEIYLLETEFKTAFNTIRSEKEIETELQGCIDDLETSKTNLEECSTNLSLIEKYNAYMTEKKNYDEWKIKSEDLVNKESVCQREFSAALSLKEKILKAESISIQNIINSINTHAQEYLEMFFPNESISAVLYPFKQNKKDRLKGKEKTTDKPQISLEIVYKEMETEISMLSGGEQSRVILAFTLAFSEIFNAPMILLDECTASLDQNTTTIVMESIKASFENKPVLVIAHQVVSGDFDRQIKLE